MPKKSGSVSLAAELATPPPHAHKKAVCLVVELANKLPVADKKALLAAIDNPRWAGRSLATVLQHRGYSVSYSAVNAHRRGDCSCYRAAVEADEAANAASAA